MHLYTYKQILHACKICAYIYACTYTCYKADMHLNICVYPCPKIHILHTYICKDECIYIYMYMPYGYIHLHMYIGRYKFVYTYISMYLSIYVCMYVSCMYAHTFIHIWKCVCKYINTYYRIYLYAHYMYI